MPVKNRSTGAVEYRCKYGLVDLDDENWPAFNAWQYLRVFGMEAGMQLLIVKMGREQVAAYADDLLSLSSAQNRRDRIKRENA